MRPCCGETFCGPAGTAAGSSQQLLIPGLSRRRAGAKAAQWEKRTQQTGNPLGEEEEARVLTTQPEGGLLP